MGTGIDLRAVWLTARPRLRAQWRSLLGLTLIAGLVGAAVLAAASASRRAGTSFDRLMDAAASATVEAEVGEGGDVDPELIDRIGDLEGVEGASLVAFVALLPESEGVPFADGITFTVLESAGTNAYDGLIVEGRALDPAADDEVLLNPAMADRLGLGVGDQIELSGLAPDDALLVLEGDGQGEVDTFSVSATIVGITRGAEDVADPSDPYTFASSALATSSGAAVFPGIVGIRAEGELATVIREVERLLPDTVVRPSDDLRSRIIDGIDVQAKGLVAFALVVGAVGLFAVAQTVGRTVAASRGEDEVLAALGVTRRERQLAAVVHVVPVAVGGAVLAVAAGIVLAPYAITGLADQAEPDRGAWFDPAVTLGVVALLVAVVVTAAVRGSRPSGSDDAQSLGVTERAVAGRLPLFAGLGVRRAVGTGARRWAGRAAAAVAVVAVAGISAVVTFDESIEHLFRTPDDWGAPFDVYVANGPNQAETLEEVAAGLGDNPAVHSAAVVSEVSGTVRRPDGVPIAAAVTSAEPAVGGLEPWTVVGGRGLRADTDALVGRGLLEDLGLDIGDPLELTTEGGEHTLQVVGTVVAYGLERVDRQIIVTPEGAADLGAESEDPGIVARFVDGADVDLEVQRLSDALYGVERLAPPAAIDNLDELGVLPTVLALTVGALGLAAVAHALSTSVRRSQREVASLRALGTTGRQLRQTVFGHAATVGLIGLALGIPLGVALGRVTYTDTAEGVGALARPEIPLAALATLVSATMLAVLLIAVFPGHRITHLDPAASLREE